VTREPEISHAYIGLGSNLGDREENLRAALREIEARGVGRVVSVSSFIETAPWGVTDQPSFLNAAALVETTLAPEELLTALKAIERDLGRAPSRRWGERSIDLDILLYDEIVMQSDDLTIPHAQLHERAFALAPLAELDPGLMHPEKNVSVRELLRRITE